MFPIQTFLDRFGALLEQLDALTEDCADDAAEDLEDLNAELEDALLMLGEIKPEGEDWREELSETLEEIRALAEDYERLSPRAPEVESLASRLRSTADMAVNNLDS